MRGALTRIAVLGQQAVLACAGASVTLIERGRAMGLSVDESFDELRRRSQLTNRKLHDIARQIADDATRKQ